MSSLRLLLIFFNHISKSLWLSKNLIGPFWVFAYIFAPLPSPLNSSFQKIFSPHFFQGAWSYDFNYTPLCLGAHYTHLLINSGLCLFSVLTWVRWLLNFLPFWTISHSNSTCFCPVRDIKGVQALKPLFRDENWWGRYMVHQLGQFFWVLLWRPNSFWCTNKICRYI